MSLENWENGQPNARFWVLKLLRDHFGPGDKLVGTSQPGPYVYAQAFATRNGRRRLLLVNWRNREIEIEVPQAEGATMQFVDQTTAFDPPASATLSSDTVKLGGYAVAVVDFR